MRYLFILIFASISLFAGLENLKLDDAINLLKKNNSEIKIAKFNEDIAKFKTKIAKSYNYGSLDYTFLALRSNDAGNVFGFKLQSREASFADFGFDEFLAPMGQVLGLLAQEKNTQAAAAISQMGSILKIQPKKLNYPDPRNHFLNKLTYQIPLFTGFKLTQYEKISKAMEEMSHLDAKKIINEKIYQTKKTFYDITLVENYIKNLQTLKSNIDKLEEIIKAFMSEGYAKDTDLLEVQAKKAEVLSYLNQAKLNRDLAYQFLEFLIGEKVDSISHVEELAPLPKGSVKELVEKTFDMKKVKIGLKIMDENIKLQKSGLYPMIGAFGEYSSADDKPFNDFEDHDAYTIGAQLKWNLFNGGETTAQIQKAKIEKMKMAEQYILAKRGLALKINQIITEVKSKDYDVNAKKKQFDFSKRVYEHYEGKYKEGLVKISDVLIKHSEEIKALLDLLKVKTQRNEKVFELESLIDKEN
ncbi:TolC family protein [Nitrosophilus kaiyonis]|uniref:TolC family protein n=1 Tax=Nitrosophilus kaiyonis TaxID=2930200 RepID=UPI00249098B2|nr:TolC family protein [Nitrosophilus kaiyonis]